MTRYDQELREFHARFALRVVLENGGSVSRTATAVGIHRNTLTRWLHAGGYKHRELWQVVRRHRAGQLDLPPRKPVAGVKHLVQFEVIARYPESRKEIA